MAAEFGFTFLEQDVTDEERWSQVIREIQQRHGGLHVLVNNAGILSPPNSGPEEGRLADWRRVFAINVEGVFLGCPAAIPAIGDSGGGSIVNMSSIAQHCAERRLNIRCNSVHPGFVRTPPWEKAVAEKARVRGVSLDTVIKERQAAVPMGDLTLPQDVAASVAFLASDDSRHMTGAQLVIDGGLVDCDTYHMNLNSSRS